MKEIVIESVDNFYGICLFQHFYLNPVWWSLFSSTGRVCLRPTAFAGPKSRKSDHQTYINLKLAKINKFHMGRRTLAGSVSALRAPQGHKQGVRQQRSFATMRPTHHLVPNVRFRKTKSTVRVKSRKSDHKIYFNLKIVKINKFHNGRRIICGV